MVVVLIGWKVSAEVSKAKSEIMHSMNERLDKFREDFVTVDTFVRHEGVNKERIDRIDKEIERIRQRQHDHANTLSAIVLREGMRKEKRYE